MSEHSRFRRLAPSALTAANVAVGFGSMLAAANERFDVAVYLLLTAIYLDMFDGRLARRFGVTSELGQQLDSFSDSISFCAAPAFLIQRALLTELEGVGVAVSLCYLLCGVFRLARFNLTTDAHEKKRKTLGLPTPIAAGYIMALTLMRDHVTPEIGVAVVLAMAFLMVSRVRLPEVQGGRALIAAFFIGALNYFAVVIEPNWYTVGWWNLWNLVILWLAHREDRALAAAGA